MKQLIIVTLFTLFALNLSADMGYCYKYKIKYKLKDSGTKIGFLIYMADDKSYGTIKSIDTILNRIRYPYQDSLIFYSEINKLDSIKIDNNIYSVYVTPKSKTKKVCSMDIVETEILKIEECCSPLIDLGNNKYYIETCCIPILTELTQKEIEQFQYNRPSLSFSYRGCPDEVLLNLVIISFNNSLSKSEIENDILEFYCNLGRETSMEGLDKYREFKNYFNKKDIIIFKNCF